MPVVPEGMLVEFMLASLSLWCAPAFSIGQGGKAGSGAVGGGAGAGIGSVMMRRPKRRALRRSYHCQCLWASVVDQRTYRDTLGAAAVPVSGFTLEQLPLLILPNKLVPWVAMPIPTPIPLRLPYSPIASPPTLPLLALDGLGICIWR